MRKISIEISEDQFVELERMAEHSGLKTEELIHGLLDDYTGINSAGSDEHKLIHEWVSKRFWP